MTTAHELIAELPEGELIPLPAIRRIINKRLGPWDADVQSYAVRTGAIRTAKKVLRLIGEGQDRRGLVVDRDEAALILVAASLAFAADVPVVSMIRALRISGIDPALFTQAT